MDANIFENHLTPVMLIFIPDGLVVSHLPYGPTAYFNLSSVIMRHDIPDSGTMSEAYPHLIFNNFKSKLGQRVRQVCHQKALLEQLDILLTQNENYEILSSSASVLNYWDYKHSIKMYLLTEIRHAIVIQYHGVFVRRNSIICLKTTF